MIAGPKGSVRSESLEGIAKPRIASSVVLSREGRKDRSSGCFDESQDSGRRRSKRRNRTASRHRRGPSGLVSSCRGEPVDDVFRRFFARVRAAVRVWYQVRFLGIGRVMRCDTESRFGPDRERGKIAVKLLRAHGGCLGVRRRGVEVCDMLGGADKQASIPRFLG